MYFFNKSSSLVWTTMMLKTTIANWRERIMFPRFHSTEICFAVSYRIRAKEGLDLVKTALQCESPKSLFITFCNRIHYDIQTRYKMLVGWAIWKWITHEPQSWGLLKTKLFCTFSLSNVSFTPALYITSELQNHICYLFQATSMSGFNNRIEHSLKKTSGYMSSDFMIRMALKNNT